jgi:DNA-directed RNA polymerase specialized sigma24 family protein
MDIDYAPASMPLPNQLKYVQAICNRTTPNWLRCFIEPDDIAQEAMIGIWRASQQGRPIQSGLLTCAARHAVANAIRHFNTRKQRFFRNTTLFTDAPAVPATDEPVEYRQIAQSVLGGDALLKLIQRPKGRARDVAVHRAKKRINEYWQQHGCWPEV